MLNIFSSLSDSETLSADEIVDQLESGAQFTDEQPEVVSLFGRDHRTRHANTFLLQALAWNRLVAADKLLDLDVEKIALNTKDFWPTGSNTPLLLAAKIDAVNIISKLVALGASLNEQDYREYTALHYACMLRSDPAIRILLSAGASTRLRDVFGNQPIDYYQTDITLADLAYPYGLSPENSDLLAEVADTTENYYATQNKSYSVLRWFVPHVIVNHGWGKDYLLNDTEANSPFRTLYDCAEWYLQNRQAVYRAQFYEAMLKCFCLSRPLVNKAIMEQLTPA